MTERARLADPIIGAIEWSGTHYVTARFTHEEWRRVQELAEREAQKSGAFRGGPNLPSGYDRTGAGEAKGEA